MCVPEAADKCSLTHTDAKNSENQYSKWHLLFSVTENNLTQTHYTYPSSCEHTAHIVHQYYVPVAPRVNMG